MDSGLRVIGLSITTTKGLLLLATLGTTHTGPSDLNIDIEHFLGLTVRTRELILYVARLVVRLDMSLPITVKDCVVETTVVARLFLVE